MIALRPQILFLLISLTLLLPMARAQEMPILTDPSPNTTDVSVKSPEYDVASVKQNKSGDGMMRIMNKPDGFSCTNVPLKTLIANAYGIRQDLIFGGAGWVNSTGFDVEAKVAGTDVEAFKKLGPRQRNSLLQALLAERFALKLHGETKVLPMFDLIVAKGGAKLKAAAPVGTPASDANGTGAPQPHGMMTMGPGMFRGQDLPMTALANQFSYIVHYTVVDKTGLTGRYDMDLKWTPDDVGQSGEDASAGSGASIFTAVQEQLGLRLQSTKGPVETLIIDHVELPSED
jgi:uncharacterized protein (TIGR03435 family)